MTISMKSNSFMNDSIELLLFDHLNKSNNKNHDNACFFCFFQFAVAVSCPRDRAECTFKRPVKPHHADVDQFDHYYYYYYEFFHIQKLIKFNQK